MKKTGKVSLAVMVCCFTCVAQQNVEVQRKEKQIEITIGGKPFTTYYFDEAVAKPYLMPLRSAQGTIVTRGYPVGNEVPPGSERDKSFEPHQRPLYFAHGNIGGLDFYVDTWVRANDAEIEPGSDRAHIEALIRAKGYKMPAGMMYVRLVHLLDEQKRKELMIIYGEDVASSGVTAAELHEGGKAYDQWPIIEKGLVERAEKKIVLEETGKP